MFEWKRSRLYLAVAALALSLGACGSDGPTATCPAGTTGSPPNCQAIVVPQACVQTVVDSDSGSAEPRTLYFHDFSVPDSGRLDITVDYTNASSRVGVYLTPANTCSLDEFNARSCNFLVRSEPPGAKPRKISIPITAGNYRWLVGNFSDVNESLSQQFVLSKGTTCPAASGAAPFLSAHEPAALPALRHVEPR